MSEQEVTPSPTAQRYTQEERAKVHAALLAFAMKGGTFTEATKLNLGSFSLVQKLWYYGHLTKLEKLEAVRILVERKKHKATLERSQQRIKELEVEADLHEKERQAAIEVSQAKLSLIDQRKKQEMEEELAIAKTIVSSAKTNAIQAQAMSGELLRRSIELTQIFNTSVETWIESYRRSGNVIPVSDLAFAQKLLRENVRIAKDAQLCTRMAAETDRLLKTEGQLNEPKIGINIRVTSNDQVDTNLALAERNRQRELRRAQKEGKIVEATVEPVIVPEYNQGEDHEEELPDDYQEGLEDEAESTPNPGDEGSTGVSSGEC